MINIKNQSYTKNQFDSILEKDIWKVEDIGLKPDSVHSKYYFNFSKLSPYWLKHTVKRYVRFQAARNSPASCHSYLAKLMYFGKFLDLHYEGITPEKINRKIIMQYIEYLGSTHLSVGSRILALIHLRTFHQIVMEEKWLAWPVTPLIYSSDFPKRVENIPRFIPESVLTQLQQHLHHLPEYMQRLINLLLETGRRISELCTLPFDCLEQDNENDYFLKVNDKKMKKFYLIPISTPCIKLIKVQQEFVFKSC